MKYQFIQKLRKLFQWVLERFFLHKEKVKKEKKKHLSLLSDLAQEAIFSLLILLS